jgi:hypothetical protein
MADLGGNVGKELAKVASGAINEVAGALDKHGASAWVAGVGVAMIAFALGSTEGSWSHLRSGEFVAVLAAGVVFVLTGVVYRLYASSRADQLLRAVLGEQGEEARALRTQMAETLKEIVERAPKG